MDIGSIVSIAVSFFMIIIVFISAISESIKFAILVISLIVIAIAKRGVVYYSIANKALKTRDINLKEKALKNYKKAIKAGINHNYKIRVANIFIQLENIKEGKEILTSLLPKLKRTEQLAPAKIALAVGFWFEKDTKTAIKYTEEAYSTGYRDRNLYINLATYYLDDNRYEDFITLMNSIDKDEPKYKISALVDYHAVSYILRGNWKKASSTLREVLTKPCNFADPYLHLAQVHIHYKNYKEAITTLKSALEDCEFNKNATVSQEAIISLIALIDSDKEKIFTLNETSPYVIANGKLIQKNIDKIHYEKYKIKQTGDTKDETFELDDVEINTDLDESDEEWSENHK